MIGSCGIIWNQALYPKRGDRQPSSKAIKDKKHFNCTEGIASELLFSRSLGNQLEKIKTPWLRENGFEKVCWASATTTADISRVASDVLHLLGREGKLSDRVYAGVSLPKNLLQEREALATGSEPVQQFPHRPR